MIVRWDRAFPPPVGESPVLRTRQPPQGIPSHVSTPCRGITCAEIDEFDSEEDDEVSTPCRGITCAESKLMFLQKKERFPPPVGESPVLSHYYRILHRSNRFPPPVGESPVLRQKIILRWLLNVSTPCRGITCAEETLDKFSEDIGCFHPLSGNHLC